MAGRSGSVSAARQVESGTLRWQDFDPNPWNVNKMGGFEYSKLLESMQRWGFTDPVTVREHPGRSSGPTPPFQIIDGEHRWRAAQDLGLDIHYFNIGRIEDDEAIALGLALNELRGRHDPRELGGLLKGLLDRSTPAQMLTGLPFTDDALKGLVGLKDFDWGNLTSENRVQSDTLENPSPKKGMRWVERTFRLPPEANEVLQEALDRVKHQEDIDDDWKALEYVAADFLAGG